VLRILIVEDEEHKLQDLRKALEPFASACEVHEVTSVDRAVVTVEESDWNVIVLDILLPNFSGEEEGTGFAQATGGLEVVRALQHASKFETRVIVVTQYPEVIINGESVPLGKLARRLNEQYGIKDAIAIVYSYDQEQWINELRAAFEGLV
jgi:CheY-like chemotaxis protein